MCFLPCEPNSISLNNEEVGSSKPLEHSNTKKCRYSKVNQHLLLYAIPVHVMKAYRRSESLAPLVLILSTRWMWAVSFMPWPLYPQKNSSWCPLNRRQCCCQIRARHFGEEKNLLSLLLGFEPVIIHPLTYDCTRWTISGPLYAL
jgi:hypothetical protein